MTEIRDTARLIPAKHVFFAMDACYSGLAAARSAPRVEGRIDPFNLVRGRVRQILTAGDRDQPVLEEAGHGIFTRRLLEGLAGEADTNPKDGIITALELASWLAPRVTIASANRQTPFFGTMEGIGEFVFVLPQQGVVAFPVPPSPQPRVEEEIRQQLGALAISAAVEGVEVLLGDRKIGETRPGRALVVLDLPIGLYTIRARKAGYKDWELTVDVAANQRAELLIDIEALGPAKTAKSDDGAEMVLVPAGEFMMGSNDYDGEKPPHRVYLDAFYIDKYETTNALYKRFMDATSRAAPSYDSTWTGAASP